MDSGKECQPRPGVVSLTAVVHGAENGWPFNWLVDEDPFSDDRCNLGLSNLIGKGSILLSRVTFTKEDRIRTSAQYRMLSRKGKRHYSDHFILVSRSNQLSRSRLGITVSKKVGKAVTRNRIKRTIREYFRLNRSLLAGWLDINVIARKSSGCLGAAEIRNHLEICFEAIGLKAELRND